MVKLKNRNKIYLIDTRTKTKKVLFHNSSILHHVDYSEQKEGMVVNFDDKLFYMDLESEEIELIMTNNSNDKLNPYIWKNAVCFSSNFESEYFRIYAIDVDEKAYFPKLVHYSHNDVRLPKIFGDDLFFIEVENSEYLLKKKNLNSSKVLNITDKGVVYNYDVRKSQIYYIYSDYDTPKSLYIYGLDDRSAKNVTSKSIASSTSYRYINGSNILSSAYEYYPVDQKGIKGVVLFFRPGLHSDFSPRWDPVLTNLVQNGYIIISPNYPMSTGFGKTYYNASFEEAVNDMGRWVDKLGFRFQNLPVYCLSSSSGNLIMEHVLSRKENKVDAAVSMFGIPAFDVQSPKVPTLYILGENDPLVEFTELSKKLNESSDKNIRLKSYPDEGHWFRKQKNIENSVMEIIEHFCRYGNDSI